jgi:hypothetical protein
MGRSRGERVSLIGKLVAGVSDQAVEQVALAMLVMIVRIWSS